MSSAEERDLGLWVGGALTIIKPGPAPVTEIVLEGRGVRRRRRAAGAGAIAVMAAIAVAVPGLLHAAAHTGQSPGPPARPLTVGRLAPGARHGVIGSGTVDGKPWTVQLAGRPDPVAQAAGLPATGRLGTTPVGSAPVTFAGAGTGQERLLAGPVSPAVAYLAMQVADGPVYQLWPVAWRGHRYIGLVLPRNLAVARFTAYSAHGELAYAIPFPVGGFPLVVTWLRPGARRPGLWGTLSAQAPGPGGQLDRLRPGRAPSRQRHRPAGLTAARVAYSAVTPQA